MGGGVSTGISMQVTIDDAEVQALVKAAAARCRGLKPVLKNFGEYMLLATEERFAREHDPDGRAWAPLSARRLAEKKGPKILTERSRLRKSMAYKVGATFVRIGTNVVYGAVHQLGFAGTVVVRAHRRKVKSRNVTSGRRKVSSGVGFVKSHHRKMNMPARPFLGVSTADTAELIAILRDYVLEGETS